MFVFFAGAIIVVVVVVVFWFAVYKFRLLVVSTTIMWLQ